MDSRVPTLNKKEITEQILIDLIDKGSDWRYWTYDDDTDTFYLIDSYYEEPEFYNGHEVVVDGESKHVYALGAHAWVWTVSEST